MVREPVYGNFFFEKALKMSIFPKKINKKIARDQSDFFWEQKYLSDLSVVNVGM